MVSKRITVKNTIIDEEPTSDTTIPDLLATAATASTAAIAPTEATAPSTDECIFCNNTFKSDDKKMELICGCYTVHTNCALKLTANTLIYRYVVPRCDKCNSLFYTYNDVEAEVYAQTGTGTATAQGTNINLFEALKLQKDSLRDIKKINAYRLAANKAHVTFMKKIKQKSAEFHLQSQIHILALKLLKREYVNNFKLSTEYKEAINKNTVYQSSLTRFRKKYNVTFVQRKRHWQWRRQSPHYQLKYKFRILL